MKSIKVLVVSCFMMFGLTAFGQVTEQIKDAAKATSDLIYSKVDLTEDQKTLVYRQVYTYEANMIKFASIENMDDNMKAAQKSMSDNYVQNMKQILTKDEYSKVKSIVEKK